jgi:RNA polymerase sigma-70 factor (ECF subfamily)
MRRIDELRSVVSDEQLVAQARSEDLDAFGQLAARYERALEGILLPLARDREQAKDLVQETVLRAFKNLHRYEDGHRFSTWFFRIGVNLAISARRRAQLEQRILEEEEPARQAAARTSLTPLEVVLWKEDKERLSRALSQLPERYQSILALRYAEGLSCKEVAERLNTTPNTVSIILFRAKQRLKEELAP